MFQRLPSMKALHAFEAAARHASFTEAATELSLTPGAIGYQVRQLESSVGEPLFHRRTRQVVLTPAGKDLYRIAHRLFRELDEEIRRIFPEQNETLLTVSVSTYFVTRWLSRRLGMFLNAEPGITLRLQHSVNDPDFTVSEVDFAIRWGDGRWQDSQSELLIAMPMIVYCAPALLAGETGLKQPRDLLKHTLLYDQPGTDRWPEWLQTAGLDPAKAPAGPVIVDPNVRVQSAIDGYGLVLGNRMMQAEIEAGELVEPFDIRLEGYGYYLIYKKNSKRSRSFRLFRQWLREQASAYMQTLTTDPIDARSSA